MLSCADRSCYDLHLFYITYDKIWAILEMFDFYFQSLWTFFFLKPNERSSKIYNFCSICFEKILMNKELRLKNCQKKPNKQTKQKNRTLFKALIFGLPLVFFDYWVLHFHVGLQLIFYIVAVIDPVNFVLFGLLKRVPNIHKRNLGYCK